MQNPPIVRGLEARGAGERDGDRGMRIEADTGERAPHRSAGEQLHDQQTEAVVLDKVIDRDHMRVVERGQQPALGGKPTANIGIGGERGW